MRKLFSANPARIGRFDGPPKDDAVPASLVDGTPSNLKADLIALLGGEIVLHRAIDLVRYASDASPYRLVPQVVVLPRTTDDIVKLFRYCHETGRHATFRAAGTSLNGQSLSDDILIDVRRHWYGAKVEDAGRRVRARPGTILSHVNSLLQQHGRRLGPDPASSGACTIGGVIANNSGGMRCTVSRDAYHTVTALTFVTTSGAVIDTSRPDAEKEFALAEPHLAKGLLELRKELLADPALADRTRRKYAIRNTHGLRLCALLDGETPLEIFRRLLVGSEGALAFIAEAVIETIPAPRVTSVAWIPVPTIDEAIALVPGLVDLGASAVELMGTQSPRGRLRDSPGPSKLRAHRSTVLNAHRNGATTMPYSDYKCFEFRFDSGVAFASINHPPINLLDEVLSAEFDRLGRELEADESVRVVVLQSAIPDFFIAHSGLGRVGAASKRVSHTRSFRLTQMIGERFRNMPKVTIAKIEGRARGGGNEIALAMDMCFAAVGKAIFGQPEVAVGLVPGGGSTQRLPRLVGRGRALEVLLGCDDFSAELAERYGYINRALPADELTPFVESLAHRIASFPAHTVAHVKAAVDLGAVGSLAEGLLVEAHESDLSVASEVTQARVAEALKVGAETYEGELELEFLSRLSPITG